jgi:hypothetical protein
VERATAEKTLIELENGGENQNEWKACEKGN